MDGGTVVEFDHPHNLLKNREGLFYDMVERTGRDTAEMLHNMAAEVLIEFLYYYCVQCTMPLLHYRTIIMYFNHF